MASKALGLRGGLCIGSGTGTPGRRQTSALAPLLQPLGSAPGRHPRGARASCTPRGSLGSQVPCVGVTHSSFLHQ